MRYAFIADVPDWALHRQGLGLVKYGAWHGHTWDLFHARPKDFEPEELAANYDAIRVGGTGVLYYLHTQGLLAPIIESRAETRGFPRVICSFASFRDEPEYRGIVRWLIKSIDAFMAVDGRLLSQCGAYKRAAVHVPDRTDPETFKPMVDLRPQSGPLRVGWAGSVAFWPQIKHPDAIEAACKATPGVVFVRQDRELDGQKSAPEMARWYNSLDLYCVANDRDTPTPVPWLEAAACGVPILGTRCGELWPIWHAFAPPLTIDSPAIAAIVDGLERAKRAGRERLHNQGLLFQSRFRHFLYWNHGVAVEFTKFVSALCGDPEAIPGPVVTPKRVEKPQ